MTAARHHGLRHHVLACPGLRWPHRVGPTRCCQLDHDRRVRQRDLLQPHRPALNGAGRGPAGGPRLPPRPSPCRERLRRCSHGLERRGTGHLDAAELNGDRRSTAYTVTASPAVPDHRGGSDLPVRILRSHQRQPLRLRGHGRQMAPAAVPPPLECGDARGPTPAHAPPAPPPAPPSPGPGIPAPAPGKGFWMASSAGPALLRPLPSLRLDHRIHLNQPVMGIASSPSGNGTG